MATALRFSQNIRSIASRIDNRSVSVVKKVSKAALKTLVYATPVDEGVARSNWRVSLINPTYSVIPAYHPGKNLGIKETQNAEATISIGYSVIDKLTVSVSSRSKAGNSLYISNNTPYIERLNDGYSSQNRAGNFIEKASIVARREIRNFKLLVRGREDGE